MEAREHIGPADSNRVREDVFDVFSFSWLYNIQVYTLCEQQEVKVWRSDKRKG